ncbi:iron-containing alcohol dehydrogenase [Dubosiella newyorkensis]|nr:iron-containing alcohol dehydrogenase [Dubosiella newyorkensis]
MSTFTIPTHIEIGPDSLSKLPALIKAHGTKVLLVHGHRPLEDGLLQKVRVLLNEEHVPHANLGQILPNPKYSSVKRGIEVARKEKCDIILALGGGSTLQCAKGIALGVPYQG